MSDNLGSVQMWVERSLQKIHFLIARDVVSEMEKSNVSDVNDFQWIAQLRYYYEESCIAVRMITTTIMYGYEYLGNSGRLVITPLTDRCYRYDMFHLIGAFIFFNLLYFCTDKIMSVFSLLFTWRILKMLRMIFFRVLSVVSILYRFFELKNTVCSTVFQEITQG